MLGKRWLNRYLQSSSGSAVELCEDRQRKCDSLEKWRLVESLPVILHVSLFLLACGLCRHLYSINTAVAYALINITGLGDIQDPDGWVLLGRRSGPGPGSGRDCVFFGFTHIPGGRAAPDEAVYTPPSAELSPAPGFFRTVGPKTITAAQKGAIEDR